MKKWPPLALLLPLASALLASNHLFAAERCVFPNDPSVLDVKRDFGAKGDGLADDTAALQAGIAASSNRGKDGGTKILFLPNGTYRVTSNLVVKAGVGPWVDGESRDVVDAAFSATGVREISFGNTYPVKTRERRGEEVRSEKGGGWIGWALFRSRTNNPASVVRQAAKLNPAFPLKASENRRYLVDQTGKPFFVMGDTPWYIQKLKIEDARMLMDDRVAKGFNTLFLELLDDSRIPSKDGYGNAAFQTDTDLTLPVEAYWNYAEQVMEEAEKRGLFVLHSELWYGAGGGLWMHHVKPDNAKVYGAFIGRRFARFKNLMWMHAGDRNPDANLAECTRVLAREIKAAAPHHLHTVHNAHEFASARFHHEDAWLDVNLGYTYGAAYLHILPEYQRTNPVRPVILGETGYEAEPNATSRGAGGVERTYRTQPLRALAAGGQGPSAPIPEARPRQRLLGFRGRGAGPRRSKLPPGRFPAPVG